MSNAALSLTGFERRNGSAGIVEDEKVNHCPYNDPTSET